MISESSDSSSNDGIPEGSLLGDSLGSDDDTRLGSSGGAFDGAK